MIKITTNLLYQLQKELDRMENRPIHADIYYADTLGMPGTPTASARDRYGVERVLVIWTERPSSDR